MLEDNLILVQQNENFKPDFISENLFDLSTEESKNKLSNILKEYKNNKNCNTVNVTLIPPENIFFEKIEGGIRVTF